MLDNSDQDFKLSQDALKPRSRLAKGSFLYFLGKQCSVVVKLTIHRRRQSFDKYEVLKLMISDEARRDGATKAEDSGRQDDGDRGLGGSNDGAH